MGVPLSLRGFRCHAGTVGVWLVLASSSSPLLSGCGKPVDHPEIRGVLGKQEQAWNRGDLDGFMQGYWKSDELVFSSPKGQTRGWQAVLEQYRQSYSTREKMGRLAFEELQIARPGEDQAEVSGKYRLKHPDGPRTGRFYLYMQRIDGAWVIVKDYTVDG